MLNPIFKGIVQWRKHPGRCVFAELELLGQKTKHVVQMIKKAQYCFLDILRLLRIYNK